MNHQLHLLRTLRPLQSRRGMALVLTLSSVVLMTVLILAFFSRAQLNRQISYSSTNLYKSDTLARTALDVITGELRAEISDASRSTPNTASGLTLFQPISAATWLPSSQGVVATGTPLVKVSGSGIAIRPGGTITGSSISINSTSINGRYLSSSRWFTSTSVSPRLGSQGTLPTWLFVTRSNGVKTPTVANAKDATNGDYVIGRFAYTVYDIGSLFDLTLAGYPSSAPFATPATEVGQKSSSSYVDLSLFGLSTTTVDNYVRWRNATTAVDAAGYLEWSAGIQRTSGISNVAALAVAQNGHRSMVCGDNTPLSRHDLIANPTLSAPLGNNTFPFTHFSRTYNGPCYNPAFPSAPTGYNSSVNPNLGLVRFGSDNTSLTHYHDDGSSETVSVTAGDPLLQRRFSLAKLAWLAPTGINTTTYPQLTAQTVKTCFGLTWDNSNARWQYTSTSATTGGIMTLTEVAALSPAREPNFFELLKAGILTGSLGKASELPTMANTNSATVQTAIEGNKDLQILRIGANMIDSADSDDYPTTITLNVSGIDVPVHGVEDLPYLFCLSTARIATTVNTLPNINLPWTALVAVPILHNPHQASGATPPTIRARIRNGTLGTIALSGGGSSSAIGTAYAAYYVATPATTDLSGCAPITILSSQLNSFRSRVKPIDANDSPASPARLSTLINDSSYTSSLSGFLFYKYNSSLVYTYPSATEFQRNLSATVNNLQIVLEFQDASGAWRIYDILCGNEAFSVGSGLGTNLQIGFTTTLTTSSATGHSNTAIGYGQARFDPRTIRYGILNTGSWNVSMVTPLVDTATNGGQSYFNPNSFSTYLPFSPVLSTTNTILYSGLWPEGGKVSWNTTTANNIFDPDGVTRPADAWLNATNANPYRSLTDYTRRPVILQRPFRNVGELAQVYRDNPYKTLNFFDEDSADKALLDLFSVSDEPTVTAGRVHLNSQQTAIQQTLFTGAAQVHTGSSPLSSPGALATAYNSFAFLSGVPTTSMACSLGNFVNFLSSASLPINGTSGLDAIKYHREAVVRAVSSTTQTRTWNLLIDVVAQSGHYTVNSAKLDDFLVEGERRYWLSIAIDRLTGKVIDQQLEPAND